MLYGNEKVREMERALMFSSNNKSTRRDFDKVRRITRHNSQLYLNKYRNAYASEAEEIYDEDFDDLNEYIGPDRSEYGWGWLIEERRMKDKVSMFLHWVEGRVEDVPEDERYDYLRSLFSDTAAGRHALSHCKGSYSDDPYWNYYFGRRRTSEEWDWVYAAEYAQAFQDLTWIIESGRHHEFNRRIKGPYVNPLLYREPEEVHCGQRPHESRDRNPSLLHGLDDVEGFIGRNGRKKGVHEIINKMKEEAGIDVGSKCYNNTIDNSYV